MPFLAHIGFGLGMKQITPKVPGWILAVSALFLDLMAFIIGIFGDALIWITHGLAMSIIWTFVVLFLSYLIIQILQKQERIEKMSFKSGLRISSIIALIVFSHWILDFIGWPLSSIDPTHTYGTPLLFANKPAFSLGVYETLIGALIMEFSFLIVGILLYVNAKKKYAE